MTDSDAPAPKPKRARKTTKKIARVPDVTPHQALEGRLSHDQVRRIEAQLDRIENKLTQFLALVSGESVDGARPFPDPHTGGERPFRGF